MQIYKSFKPLIDILLANLLISKAFYQHCASWKCLLQGLADTSDKLLNHLHRFRTDSMEINIKKKKKKYPLANKNMDGLFEHPLWTSMITGNHRIWRTLELPARSSEYFTLHCEVPFICPPYLCYMFWSQSNSISNNKAANSLTTEIPSAVFSLQK